MNLNLNTYRDACSKCPESTLFVEAFARSALIEMNLRIIKSKSRSLVKTNKAKAKLKTYRQMEKIVVQTANRFGVSSNDDFKAWYGWWLNYFRILPLKEQERIKNDYLKGRLQDNWGHPSDNWH